MENMTNSIKIVTIICITVFLIALISAVAFAATIGSRQHNQIIQTCINSGGQWINGSCVRGSR